MAEGLHRRYAIISPVRDEAEFIRQTLESVVEQVELPAIWLIVDDGSTDGTASLVREFAQDAPFIRLVSLDNNNRGTAKDRLLWAAEAIAFNVGLRDVALDEFDFIVKLDGDLAFGPDYFASLLDEFERDETLGIAGGQFFMVHGGKTILEWNPENHVRGATKIYRTACFRDIRGIESVYAWDTLDELRAQMAGWTTRSFGYPVQHLRPTSSRSGQLRGIARGGLGAYLLGYHPLFVFARAVREAMTVPFVIGGMAFLGGYLKASIQRPPRVVDRETIVFLRRQQLERLRSLGDMSEIKSIFGALGR
jgi:poly-beta-1,6-N-acetyl-D-glucosamine synthase